MESTFGARLRLQRERHGVSLATIAANTKIKVTLLEGLERDDVSQWPSGIFRRSYVRTYAQAIGLDPDSIAREFLEHYPDPIEEGSPVEAIARADGITPRRPPTRLTYLINSAINALPSMRPHAPAPAAALPLDIPPIGSRPISVPVGALADGDREHRITARHTKGHTEQTDKETSSDASDAGFDTPEWTAEWTDVLLRPDLAEAADGPWSGERMAVGAVHPTALPTPRRSANDVEALADLCTRLGRAEHARDVLGILGDVTAMTEAIGLILWTWDSQGRTLRPVLNHGYSDDLLAQVPSVRPDSDNAIASAFRSAEIRMVDGSDASTGAVAVPLLAPFGCVGVLAAEFRDGLERQPAVRAVLTILAAQLSMLIDPGPALRAATA